MGKLCVIVEIEDWKLPNSLNELFGNVNALQYYNVLNFCSLASFAQLNFKLLYE